MSNQFYCGICGGLFNLKSQKGNRKMWCDDCKPLAEKAYMAEYYKRKKAEKEQMRADAALGAAVRRMPAGVLIAHGDAEWRVWRKATDYNSMSDGDTPEDAMIAAGLMKGEGK